MMYSENRTWFPRFNYWHGANQRNPVTVINPVGIISIGNQVVMIVG